MIELKGKYNTTKVYANYLEDAAMAQIIELCNQEFVEGSDIRIMPDVHAGKGCTIGTTMTIKDKVVPNLVGVDIGCGMFTVKIAEKFIDFVALDNIINKYIPSGQNIRDIQHDYVKYLNLDNLICANHINMNRALKSLGTLGGGNHFIEMNADKNGNIYLVIHSGSRYLGKQVAEYYQNLAIKNHRNKSNEKAILIEKLKAEGRANEIEAELSKIKPAKIPDALCYLEGQDMLNYLHDMNIVQYYAEMNREAIADVIMDKMMLTEVESFTTTHNYIEMRSDNHSAILRKGAIRANKDEKVLIPINMRDGSILAVGKGNPEWNYSAPHGAGRLMSRSKAKDSVSLNVFKASMKDIYSTSVCQSTLDESPMAYKSIDDIVNNVDDTIDIIEVIKPIYNYKAH